MLTADGIVETTNDSTVDTSFAEFLNFGAGVFSLVLLSCSVIWGLVAQDRILLDARKRIMAQAVHRVTAVASIVFLLVHIGIKLALEHTTWVAAVVPFGLLATDSEEFASREVLIGFGTLAGLLMLFVGVTGALRNRFAVPALIASRWRALHMLAYPAWCFALLHGLYAGRAAKPVFTFLYGLSVLGVMAALALRAARAPSSGGSPTRSAGCSGRGAAGPRGAGGEPRPRGRRAAGLRRAGRRPLRWPARQAVPWPGSGREEMPDGYGSGWAAPPPPRYEPAERPASRGRPANGFSAAYRAVSSPRARGRTSAPSTPRPWRCRRTCGPPRAWTGSAAPAAGPSRPRRRSARRPRPRTTPSTTPGTPSRPTAPRTPPAPAG